MSRIFDIYNYFLLINVLIFEVVTQNEKYHAIQFSIIGRHYRDKNKKKKKNKQKNKIRSNSRVIYIITLPPSSLCSRVCFINFRFILYLYKRTLQFGQQIGKQISSRRSRAGGLNPRRVQFNWKKVNSRDGIKGQSKGSARAERCVISHRRTQYGVMERARLSRTCRRALSIL